MKEYVKPVLSACALSSTERIAQNCLDLTDPNDWEFQGKTNTSEPGMPINNCGYGDYVYDLGGS